MIDSYISVSQINTYIKNIFDAEVMLQNICVFGEVSSYSISNGNAYFNLKDEGGLLPCVLFGANRFDTPKIGDMLLVRGSINYYAKGGKLSFNAFSIMPYGKGLLYEKFLQLKTELETRGYFDVSHKNPIPEKVKRVGVVSSETGAVIHDIIDVTHRRNDSIDIVLYPVKVQGLGAEKEIACGIDFFTNYKDVDVVIVARGGGSMEDLEPFNSELVATSTYNCTKPIISAVGHETDFTIIDFVADLRAPTPSAAAELVAWEKGLVVENILSHIRHMKRTFDTKFSQYTKDIFYNLDFLENNFISIISDYENKLSRNIENLRLIDNVINSNINTVEKLNIKLENFNPKKISSMGYSKVIKDNKVINSIRNIKSNENITISMIDGKIDCVVKK